VDLKNPTSWNRYIYGLDDPINHADPTGLCTIAGVIYPDGQSPCPDVTSVTVSGDDTDPVYPPSLNQASLFITPPVIEAQIIANALDAAEAAKLRSQVIAGMNDCDALADYADYNSGKSMSAFFNSFGILTPAQFGTDLAGIATSNSPTLLNVGQPSGYQVQYQNVPPDSPTSNGDQGHHFAAFFQLGYQWSSFPSWFGTVASNIFEVGESLVNLVKNGSFTLNTGDINLGAEAAGLGWAVAKGIIPQQAVGNWIRNNLCAH